MITGLGAITPLGDTPNVLWESLLAKKCATREWPDLKQEGFRSTAACRIQSLEEKIQGRGRQMAILAAMQAINHSKLKLREDVGIFIGSTMGESEAFEKAAEGHSLVLEDAVASAFPKAVQAALQIKGPLRAYGTGCAAGNYAIGAAADAVRHGMVKAAIAGGVEPFSRIAMVGFSRSRAMSDDFCRPFDHQRRGMQLGEAAAFVVLELEDEARQRNALPLATVQSLGLSCDAYHPTAPKPDGAGMATAMYQACHLGGIDPREVDWICAHGSGTQTSDSAEARAIETVFSHKPAVSAIKGALGHSLGASTAVETIVTALALRYRILPPTVNLQKIDPEMNLNIIQETCLASDLKWALNCGYAFGGINSALLMGQA